MPKESGPAKKSGDTSFFRRLRALTTSTLTLSRQSPDKILFRPEIEKLEDWRKIEDFRPLPETINKAKAALQNKPELFYLISDWIRMVSEAREHAKNYADPGDTLLNACKEKYANKISAEVVTAISDTAVNAFLDECEGLGLISYKNSLLGVFSTFLGSNASVVELLKRKEPAKRWLEIKGKLPPAYNFAEFLTYCNSQLAKARNMEGIYCSAVPDRLKVDKVTLDSLLLKQLSKRVMQQLQVSVVNAYCSREPQLSPEVAEEITAFEETNGQAIKPRTNPKNETEEKILTLVVEAIKQDLAALNGISDDSTKDISASSWKHEINKMPHAFYSHPDFPKAKHLLSKNGHTLTIISQLTRTPNIPQDLYVYRDLLSATWKTWLQSPYVHVGSELLSLYRHQCEIPEDFLDSCKPYDDTSRQKSQDQTIQNLAAALSGDPNLKMVVEEAIKDIINDPNMDEPGKTFYTTWSDTFWKKAWLEWTSAHLPTHPPIDEAILDEVRQMKVHSVTPENIEAAEFQNLHDHLIFMAAKATDRKNLLEMSDMPRIRHWQDDFFARLANAVDGPDEDVPTPADPTRTSAKK